MKPLLSFLSAFFFLQASSQSIQLENLTYGKKESKIVFALDNVFRLNSKEPILSLEYDKSLAQIALNKDSLTIHVIYSVKYPDRKSNWERTNGELLVSFLTPGGRQDIKFYFKRLPHAFPAIAAQPENSVVDKRNIMTEKKIEIITSTTDPESFYKGYKVYQFQLQVNNQTFHVTGNQLTDETFAAIAGATSGDKIILQEVNTINEITQRKLRFGPTTYVLK